MAVLTSLSTNSLICVVSGTVLNCFSFSLCILPRLCMPGHLLLNAGRGDLFIYFYIFGCWIFVIVL